MTIIIITICIVLAVAAAIWFTPLRKHIQKSVSTFDRFKFVCRVEQFSDESQPQRKDQFFRVQMIGRIPTEADNVETDVRLEVLDISDGQALPQQILSTDEQFRSSDSAEFSFQKNNDVVPEKNAVLANWATVAEIPCHILRFACRGRRKLLFRVTVLETESKHDLVSASTVMEYVFCSDGFREVHGRKLEVLRACIELAASGLDAASLFGDIEDFWTEWIKQKADMFLSGEEAAETIKSIISNISTVSIKSSSEVVLAYGQNTDRFSAMELALQSVAISGRVTQTSFDTLFQIAGELEINKDRFLGMAQKLLLSSDCHIDDPSQLFGLNRTMDEQSFRKRLNEEYRKWNARVTHPDPEIRRHADEILTLIATIRSEQLRPCS